MRFRGKSIRRKIVALLLVPLLSLTAIWAFATALTGREAAQLFSASSVVEKIGYPTEDVVRVLQQERRQTLVHLADPRASDGLAALGRSRAATDEAIAKVRRNADSPEVRDALGETSGERLIAVLDAFDGIESLRQSVEDGTVNRSQALDLYNRLVDPCFVLLGDFHVVDNVEMDTQYRALVNVVRARELLSREDALLGSALVVGELSRAEIRDISDLVAQRNVLYDTNLPLLPSSERERYERFWKNAATAPLRVAEESAVSAASGDAGGVSAQTWDTTAGNVLDELGTLDDEAADRYQDRVRPIATGIIVKAVVAGVLGLIAVLLSLVVSIRIGRGLVRDLRQLRLEAHEASGVRLPSVMRRLSVGEQVDVETEVPRLEFDRNEIGEVGQALNTLQRAAVEAAVKQAELRAGVSEVFVNLARRSQVLLHKQLTLLDTMERRTEDTEELADLFRLDHLTTRMRRHAEGLVILSGAAPSRQWRKPIQLMDIVRAAVAEVEDYERIEVRRLPRTAVTGPAVADLTHLVAELLENATVFSPPHTAVQVLGERVANGFTLEIHDRGLGMAAEALLDANLRLAETPEFELSDTDRLGLFVVSRLAQRQNVRVSLQPSPYGGTTAVVFVPDSLLTDEVPDTNGVGFRLDRPRPSKEAELEESRRTALSHVPVQLPGLPAGLLDGPVELEGPVDLDAIDEFPGALDEEASERGGLFRPRRALTRADEDTTTRADARGAGPARSETDDHVNPPVPLPQRRTPKLVSSHGRPVTDQRSRRADTDEENSTGPASRRPDRDRTPPLPTRRRGSSALGRTPGPGRLNDPSEPTNRDGNEPSEHPGRALGDVSKERDAEGQPGSLPDDTGQHAPLAGSRHSEGAEPPLGRVGNGFEPPLGRVGEGAEPPLGRLSDGSKPPLGRVGDSSEPPLGQPDDGSAPALGRVGEGEPPLGRLSDGAQPPLPHLGDRAEPRVPALDPDETSRRPRPDEPGSEASGTGALPRRVRQANLAPQLRQDPGGRTVDRTVPVERDADEVRSRMASLQRGWQRGRQENAAGDDAQRGTAPQGTTKGDGR
ncbi:nitrate- and nitrite sensing domain-containing protein [Streptomyces spinoverrucosus]|uniref:sensor histidine kinase n=1 Tax=Streptomyces spinoverrucosus TaxID=284043 RepID=UPI0018C35EAA|nr:nitrate- and nitrite sensing domain-containing protein [Streptomyces spinoverrucosus]MBG0856837.1 nitrate- and nitrite sensing domain-containing protein [Streptomyces spinoverrucosus]